jgi:hypothetical protein
MSKLGSVLVFAFAFLATSFSGSAGEKKPVESVPEMKVRVRLINIETAILMDDYAIHLKREIDLRDSVRASKRNGDERLPDYQKALDDTRSDLDQTRKRLLTLETDKAALIERLGPKYVVEEPSEQSIRIQRALEQILDRLTTLERRLQKLER